MLYKCYIFGDKLIMAKYSEAGQDKIVLSLFDKNHKGTFVDIGCQLPDDVNNTLLLEENGWTGIALDIEDFTEKWKTRKTPYINQDALSCNYTEIFEQYQMPKIIDYLSLDIEGEGSRYTALKRIMETGYEFKFITIEHDSHRQGHYYSEAWPQREYLQGLGYFLLCCEVMNISMPFEDWWINPKYFNESEYMHYVCHWIDYKEILKKIK